MNQPSERDRVPPLRLRYGGSRAEIVDIGWSPLPVSEDPDPWTIAFLSIGRIHPNAKSTWDVEDPTDPDNDRHPPGEAAELNPGHFVRCAASHWQRVHPRMRRFTQTELEAAAMMAGLGSVEEGLEILVEASRGLCEYKVEQHSTYR